MLPLLKKRLLPPCYSSLSSQVRSLFIRFPVIKFLSPPPPPPPPSPQPPQVRVWWDFDTCCVPSGVSFWKVAPSIMAAVRVNGIKGPIDIHAFGELSDISDVDHDALLLTGIYLNPVSGGKNYTSRCLLQAISNWVSRNPPPAHLFVISEAINNRDLSSILHGLRMNNYNILTACPGKASDTLCHATTITWNWSSMLKGEDLTGKHFNYPPSGLFNSSYGDSKVPLETPSQLFEDSKSSKVDQQQPQSKKLEEDKIRVLVWWDFDNCVVPSGVSVLKIAPSIIRALRTNGINGPVAFRAYGDVSEFSTFQRMSLFLTGVRLHHFGEEMPRDAYSYLSIDLLRWSYKNPPPAHLVIICGDEDIIDISLLHRLRMRNFNILVVCPRSTYVFRSAATMMWLWSSILKGEDLTGKHFNYPPDGPLDSWYGDTKVTVENSLSTAEEPTTFLKCGDC